MDRKSRLFAISQLMRDGQFHRAEDLALRFNVTVRTLYRDMDRLISAGVPVEGTRGTGYRLTAPITLPPLNLNFEELEALHLGLAILQEIQDVEIRQAASNLAGKIDAVLPEGGRAPAEGWGFDTYPFADSARLYHLVPTLRAAQRARQKVSLTTLGEDQMPNRVTIRPLNLDYWGRVWTCVAWVEETRTFATFEIAKIIQIKALDGFFEVEPGRGYEDYLEQQRLNPEPFQFDQE